MAGRGGLLSQAPALAGALTDAVEAATASDLTAYDAALARLALLDAPRVSNVTGAVVRRLLEQHHPGGLAGDDVGQVLSAAAARAGWLPDLDATVLLVVVCGSLGLLDPEDQPAALSPAAVLRHAAVLIASLLAGASLESTLDAALAELRRAETIELP